MAEKAKKDSKNLIAWICAVVAVVAIVIVAAILATRSGAPLDESYFESDDSKYVLTVEADDMLTEGEEYIPVRSHLVYYYSGDAITDLKNYYLFDDEETAKLAYEYYKENLSDEYKDISLSGKYIIFTEKEAEYEGITANDIKQQLELIKMLDEMNLNGTDEEGAESTESTEDAEAVEEANLEDNATTEEE